MIKRILVSDEHKFTMVWNAKCACATSKVWFLNAHNVFDWSYSPHEEVGKGNYGLNDIQDLDESPYNNYYKFMVVRNPWRRLVSYYVNKKVIMRHKNLNFHIENGNSSYSGDMTFTDLVNFLTKIPSGNREDHVESFFYGGKNIKFDKIVKVENYAEDMKEVERSLNIDVGLNFKEYYHQPPSPYSNSSENVFDKKPDSFDNDNIPSYEHFYNDDLINKVGKIYEDDIKLYNYKFED